MYVLGLVNEERAKAKLEALELDINPIAQRYAEQMLSTGEFKHNPDLPSTMGENIKYYTSRDEFADRDALSRLMYEMVYDDQLEPQGLDTQQGLQAGERRRGLRQRQAVPGPRFFVINAS